MPRKAHIARREVLPDPVYASSLVTKFVNQMMWDGKKSVSQQIFYRAMKIVEDKSAEDPLKVFKKAVENVKPVLEVKSRRVGGSTYQVPIEVREDEGNAIAGRWLIDFARKRAGNSMTKNLADELLDAARGLGGAVKKREETHRMAEANKAFAHYRY